MPPADVKAADAFSQEGVVVGAGALAAFHGGCGREGDKHALLSPSQEELLRRWSPALLVGGSMLRAARALPTPETLPWCLLVPPT